MSTARTAEKSATPSARAVAPATRDVKTGLDILIRDGVVVHENFITDAFADQLRDRMEEQAFMERKLGIGRVGDEFGMSDKATNGESGDIRVANKGQLDLPIYQILDSLVNKGEVFRELFMNETAHAYANGIFRGEPWNVWGVNGIINRRGSREQFLHTDSSILPQDMLSRPVQINCFVCVTDFEADMGPTGFVPGTHLGNRPKYDGDEWTPRSYATAKKGSAIIWDGSVWHGQGEHRSNKDRYAIAMSYCLYAVRFGENYPASIQDTVYEKLTEEQKKVLGYQTTLVGIVNSFGPRTAADKRHGIGSSPHFTPELHRD